MIFRFKACDNAIAFGVLLAFVLICSCANPIPPTGGPKDTTPPKLIAEESTPNYLIGFDRKEITLTFDEWIQLKDQNLQIVISPPLAYRPDISLKGKSVIIKFDEKEVLRDATTYLINFGGSIADVNEGNVLDQFKYVFSTGTFIDSLQVAGKIVDAETGEPAKKVLVILHDDLTDTAITKLTPAYFTRTNDEGVWKIENIRSDTFKLYALEDQNLNYKFDQVSERVAFHGESIVLPDTTNTRYTLVMFAENPKISVLDIDRRSAGVTKMILTAQPVALSIEPFTPDGARPTWDKVADTVFVWSTDPDSSKIVLSEDGIVFDTVEIAPYGGGFSGKTSLNPQKRSLHPVEPLVLQSDLPIVRLDSSKVNCVLGDSVNVSGLRIWIDTTDARKVRVKCPWIEQGKYVLTMDPGAVTDLFERTNDTVQIAFQVVQANTFGQIIAEINGLEDSVQYVIELFRPQTGVVEERIVQGVSQIKLSFAQLSPQAYHIRIIEDSNRNGRWDTGNLSEHKQPEHVFTTQLEALRAGWDLETTVTWQKK